MNIEIADLFIIFLAGAGFILCFAVGIQLLFRKEGVRLTNILLALLLILFSLNTLNSLLAMTGIYSKFQFLYFLPIIFSFSLGPLYYFFICSKIQPSFQFQKHHFIHFILPIFQFLFYLSVGFRSMEFKSWLWEKVLAPYGQFVEGSVNLLLSLGYLLAVLSLLRKVPNELWKVPVYTWLNRFTWFLLVMLFINAIYEVADWILYTQYEYNLYNSTLISFPIKLADASIGILIGYNALIYQNLAFPIIPSESVHTYTIQNLEKNQLFEEIQNLFKEQKVYLDPELNLGGFSKLINHPKNNISKALTEQGTNFRTLLNQYRVEEFIQLAKNKKYQHLSLLGLALESGFNSKSSFNRVFKELKNTTPSDFLHIQ